MLVAGVCRRLSSSVTPAHLQRNSPGAACDGGPLVLRPVRATPCLPIYLFNYLFNIKSKIARMPPTLQYNAYNIARISSAYNTQIKQN